jgi:tripartite-type tricarboxylate transporter receptor subunit TctC
MKFSRRLFVLSTFLVSTVASGTAAAQTYPSRPLRIVVPFAAGAGVLDIMARLVGQHLGQALGQQVVIDNRPGAGGIVGAEVVARAEPDGYTLLMGNTALMVSPYLYARLSFDPLTDFVAVTMVNSAPLLLVVNPSVPVQSVQELIAYARARPGQLNYGSGGVGSTPYLATELLKSMTGIDVVHVPYKGGAPALADLMAGQLAFMIENVPGTLPLMSRASSARSRSPAPSARRSSLTCRRWPRRAWRATRWWAGTESSWPGARRLPSWRGSPPSWAKFSACPTSRNR